jgi:2-keto-myo-inositol isomerase
MITRDRFALNRIIYPYAPLKDFIDFAVSCGIPKIELRNDLAQGDILDSMKESEIKNICNNEGVQIISINAVQKFNLPPNFLRAEEEIRKLAGLCNGIGCKAIVLCPTNDPMDKRTDEIFLTDTIDSLKLYAPIFKEFGLRAYIEPLGFPECSTRTKKSAIEAIQGSGSPEIYGIVHDTFHHYLSSEVDYYPEATGLVHISGVTSNLPVSSIKDEHRILVNMNDKMDSIEQINILEKNGYQGLYSFEPFAPSIQGMNKAALKEAINLSLAYLMQ